MLYKRNETMTFSYRLIVALFAVVLLIVACGGQQVAENAPETTVVPEAGVPEAEAPESETAEETLEEEVSETTTGEAADDEAAASAESFPLTIEDGAGRELTFEEPPQRVVCLFTDCTYALFDLGLQPIAVPEWFVGDPSRSLTETPGGMSNIEIIPVTDNIPSLEVIASLQPDLVIANEEAAVALEGIAPAFVTYSINSLEEMYTNLRRYAQLFDREAEAEAAIAAFQDRFNVYAAKVPSDPTVMNFAGIDPNDLSGGEVFVRTTNSPDCQLLNRVVRCPYEDPVADSSLWSFSTNVEYVLEQDPDVLLIPVQGRPLEEVRQELESDPLWRELSAIQNDRLILTDIDLGASGLADAAFLLDTVIPLIFPEVFPDGPLTDEEVQEILVEQ